MDAFRKEDLEAQTAPEADRTRPGPAGGSAHACGAGQ